jgi:hypothetical protein
VTNDQNGRKSL